LSERVDIQWACSEGNKLIKRVGDEGKQIGAQPEVKI